MQRIFTHGCVFPESVGLGMSSITPEKLAKAIEAAGIKPARLSVAIGRDKDYIRDYLVGRKRSLKAEDMERIAAEIGQPIGDLLTTSEIPLKNDLPGLPVIGTIRAGAWIETYMLDHDDRGSIPMGRDPRFPHARQYALAVSGDSMDQEAPDGSYVICVNYAESGLRLQNGMIVHVEANEHGKAETTLKEVRFEGRTTILVPKSSNPIYKPMKLGGDEGLTVEVRGVVLGVYNPKDLLPRP